MQANRKITRPGFTLIEVMVVLSILALITILAYSFFGNVYTEAVNKQHAVKMFRQLQAINDGYLEYVNRHGVRPTITNNTQSAEFKNQLVTEGILRQVPIPDVAWLTSDTCSIESSPGGTDGWVVNYSSYGGTAEVEFYSYIYCVSDPVCKAFNNLYTNLGSNIGDYHHNVEDTGGDICASNTGAYGGNLVLGIAELN